MEIGNIILYTLFSLSAILGISYFLVIKLDNKKVKRMKREDRRKLFEEAIPIMAKKTEMLLLLHNNLSNRAETPKEFNTWLTSADSYELKLKLRFLNTSSPILALHTEWIDEVIEYYNKWKDGAISEEDSEKIVSEADKNVQKKQDCFISAANKECFH